MANEGSTKPTYSELVAENLRVRGLLQPVPAALSWLLEIAKGYRAIKFDPDSVKNAIGQAEGIMRELQAELNAESADIGKLDSVDIKDEGIFGDCPVCNCLEKGREE